MEYVPVLSHHPLQLSQILFSHSVLLNVILVLKNWTPPSLLQT